MDFFVLVGGRQQTVFRLDLEQQLQNQLTLRFNQHAEDFLDGNLTVVPFERENFHPDETEILEINPYDLPESIFDAIANPVGWPVLPQDDETLSRVFCIFGSDPANDRIVFQVIPRTQRLTRSSFGLILSGGTFTRLASAGLMLGDHSHALYQQNSLRFRSIWWLKQILDISSYYRAATEADIDRLAAMECVVVEDVNRLKERSGQWVRTRVAYILDSGVLDQCPVPDLRRKAREFGLELNAVVENDVEKLVIPQDGKELRSVLKFLEEEYYAGPITGAAYEANSKRRIA